ncbi:MAG: tannase/feruloyl esterase family alpha/beta hydrolase [Streptosporangiales bacterium]|nr:tannase/feruloyl esterase family alpha/beta hydrolase [Streptosporangiales bacterium]
MERDQQHPLGGARLVRCSVGKCRDRARLQCVSPSGRSTSDFARLFLLPSVDHCGGGAGPDEFDGMAALIDWVEKGNPPDRIRAENRTPDGEVVLSRPLCPYPEVARWIGEGSTTDAKNFRCELRGLDRADGAAGFDNGQPGRNKARWQQVP